VWPDTVGTHVGKDDDPRTAYEKKWDDQVRKLEQKNAKAAAEKSHRYLICV
jgi:hypothetical protein